MNSIGIEFRIKFAPPWGLSSTNWGRGRRRALLELRLLGLLSRNLVCFSHFSWDVALRIGFNDPSNGLLSGRFFSCGW